MSHDERVPEGTRLIGPPLMSNARWRAVFAAAVEERSRGGVIAVCDPPRVERRPPMYALAATMFRDDGTADAMFTHGPLQFRHFAEAHFLPAAPGAEEHAAWLERFSARLAARGVRHEQRGERVVVHGYLGHRLQRVRDAESALVLLRELGARPRVIRHHELVVEAATELLTELATSIPSLRVDRDHVLAAAALHDVGKIEHPTELDHPGDLHEAAGEDMLLDAGVEPRLARAAVTHARWDDPRAALEDRLTAVADKLWKGKRDEPLEATVTNEIAREAALEPWRAFAILDAAFERVARSGPERLGRSVVIV